MPSPLAALFLPPTPSPFAYHCFPPLAQGRLHLGLVLLVLPTIPTLARRWQATLESAPLSPFNAWAGGECVCMYAVISQKGAEKASYPRAKLGATILRPKE